MKSQQLELIFETPGFPVKNEPYRNTSGDLLPWEEPEWIAKYGEDWLEKEIALHGKIF